MLSAAQVQSDRPSGHHTYAREHTGGERDRINIGTVNERILLYRGQMSIIQRRLHAM